MDKLRPQRLLKSTREVDEEMAHAQGQAEAIYQLAEEENRDLNEQEVQTVEQHLEYLDYLRDNVRPRTAKMEAVAREGTGRAIRQIHRQSLDFNQGQRGPAIMVRNPIRTNLQAFQAKSFGSAREAEDAARDTGHWLRAHLLNVPESVKYCKDREHLALDKWDERMGQEIGDPTKGGVLVPEIVSRTILDVRDRYSLIASIARLYPMQGETDHISKRTDGLTVYKPGEGNQITDSTKTYGQVTLRAENAYTLTYISQQLMRGSVVDAADQVVNEIAYAFAKQQDMEGVNGTGAPGAPYYGITGFVPGIQAGGVQVGSGGTWGDITTQDINLLISLLPDRFHGRNNTSGAQSSQWATRSEALFICSRPFWAQVLEPLLEAGGGSNKVDLASPSPYQLKGYRVVFSDEMPKETGLDQTCLLFGNAYDAMLFGQRQNVGIFASEHFRLDTDQLTIRGRTAYDINFHEPGDATNPGAMVALKTAAA